MTWPGVVVTWLVVTLTGAVGGGGVECKDFSDWPVKVNG